MKRSRPSSRKQKALPAGQGTCLGAEDLVSGAGVTMGTVQRRAEAKDGRPRLSLPPMADGVEVTSAEVKFLNARWDKNMDTLLRVGVLRYGGAWEEVATHMAPHGCPKDQVEKRWHMVKNNRVKGPWALEEDTLLKLLVTEYGKKRWSVVAGQFPGRTGKQCRERWLNHVDPNVKKSAWTAAEDIVLYEAQGKLGNKWASIAKLLPGRAENAVKNRFNSLRTKRMALNRGLNSTKPGHNFNEGEGQAGQDTSVLKRKAPTGFESVEAIPTDLSEDDGVTPAFIGDEGYGSLLEFSSAGPDQNSNIFGDPCNKIGEGLDDAKFLQSFFDLLEHHPMSPPVCKRRRRNAPSETSSKAMDESRNKIRIEVKDKGDGGGAVGVEGKAMGDITTAGLDHDPFRLEDVVPTPLEIGSFGGGPEDIPLMSSLGSYLTPLESRSVGSGQSSVAQPSCRRSLEPSPSYWRRWLHEANGTAPLSEGRTARVSPNLDSDGGATRRGAIDNISSGEQNFDDCVSPYPMSANSATLRLATQGIPTAPVMREREHRAEAKGYGAETSFEYFRETDFLSSPLVSGAGEGPRTSATFLSGGFI